MTRVQDQRLAKAWEAVQAERERFRRLNDAGHATAADLARRNDADFEWQKASEQLSAAENGMIARDRISYAFAVWRKSNRPMPTMRLETQAEAEAEAEQKARANPGKTFIVFREIKRFRFLPPAATAPKRGADEPGDHAPRSPGSKGQA